MTCLRPALLSMVFTHSLLHTKRLGQLFLYAANCIRKQYTIDNTVGSCKTEDRLESIGIPNSPNSISLRADYVTAVEDRPIVSAKYRLPVILRQN